ncbi:MAG: thiamine pyrophosphate-dependent enzyme [Candidatus Gastranaerophilales bacterium]|nr:thiamine pyrophosphate-dependent enzyme [Candidatus Gastranaerophilales bacterium]
METLVFKKPESIKDNYNYSFCPGCDHGVAIRLIAEVLDELKVREKTIAAASVGCSVFLNHYFNVDVAESPHGRALAVATGIKRSKPDKVVFTYQGDGDLGSIGLGESLHAASRGEKITTICINNTTYGMTGGQAGPTTLLGQVTTTTPKGRKSELTGFPLKIAEMMTNCEGAVYVARVSLDSPAQIMKAKKAIKKAFEIQISGLGLSFVEILSICPTNWHMTPKDAHERVRKEMYPIFPLGILKDNSKELK